MAISIVAIALVILAAVLPGLFDGWDAVPGALALLYLGIALLLLPGNGAASALVALATGGGIVGIFAVPAPRFGREFRPRWFDLSGMAIALVGAVGLAVARPVFGMVGADIIVYVLIFSGLLYCLLGRSPRVTVGTLFLVASGNVLLTHAGPAPTQAVTLLLALGQLCVALALARLRVIESERAPRPREAAALEPPADPMLAPQTSLAEEAGEQ